MSLVLFLACAQSDLDRILGQIDQLHGSARPREPRAEGIREQLRAFREESGLDPRLLDEIVRVEDILTWPPDDEVVDLAARTLRIWREYVALVSRLDGIASRGPVGSAQLRRDLGALLRSMRDLRDRAPEKSRAIDLAESILSEPFPPDLPEIPAVAYAALDEALESLIQVPVRDHLYRRLDVLANLRRGLSRAWDRQESGQRVLDRLLVLQEDAREGGELGVALRLGVLELRELGEHVRETSESIALRRDAMAFASVAEPLRRLARDQERLAEREREREDLRARGFDPPPAGTAQEILIHRLERLIRWDEGTEFLRRHLRFTADRMRQGARDEAAILIREFLEVLPMPRERHALLVLWRQNRLIRQARALRDGSAGRDAIRRLGDDQGALALLLGKETEAHRRMTEAEILLNRGTREALIEAIEEQKKARDALNLP